MNKELVNIVNEKDEVTDKTTREDAHKKGLLHRISATLIFNTHGKLWLQKRAKGKIGEGLLDYSASGHVGIGESYEKAAYKELSEELGIKTELKLLYQKILEKFDYPNGIKIRHIFNVYIGRHDGPFKIQKDELENIRLYNLDDLKMIIKNNKRIMTEGLRLTLNEYFKDLAIREYLKNS